MTDTHQFETIFSAFLFANLLTAAFIWGVVSYNRLERDGKNETKAARLPLAMIIMPLLFLLGTFYVSGR